MTDRFDTIYDLIDQLDTEITELQKEVIFTQDTPTTGETAGASDPSGSGSSIASGGGISDGSSIPSGSGNVINILNDTNVLPRVLVDLGTGGVTQNYWSQHLRLRWKNNMGDWRDLNDTSQGLVPFSQVSVVSVGEISLDVTNIVKSGKPIILINSGKSSPKAVFYGRLSEFPPKLIVTDTNGSSTKETITGFASWNSSSDSPVNSTLTASVSSISRGGISYSCNVSNIASATLILNVKSYTYTPVISTYKCDVEPPLVAGGGRAVVYGIARAAGSEEALKQHPSVFLACDFSTPEESFTGFSNGTKTVPEILDDPDSPGRKIIRGKFVPNEHGSMSFSLQLSKPDLTDPRRPILYAPEQFYQRMYITLEEDFLDVWQDGQKSGLGIDQRFGWWNDSGYWQPTTGNGGIVGSGRRFLRPAGTFYGLNKEQWEYQGHSQRMEFGMAPPDPSHAYHAYRPIQMYTYHIDQRAAGTGDNFVFGNACMPIGKKVCIESFVKTNTVVGPYDENGNGEALYDGIMALWIDGAFIGSINNFRWRRHPHMGVEGPWGVWYYGGRGYPPHDMHYQMSDFVCATEYIGPKAI